MHNKDQNRRITRASLFDGGILVRHAMDVAGSVYDVRI